MVRDLPLLATISVPSTWTTSMQRVLCNGNIEWQMYNGVGTPPHFPIPSPHSPPRPLYPVTLFPHPLVIRHHFCYQHLSTLPLSHLHTNYVSGNIVDGNIVHAVIFCTL